MHAPVFLRPLPALRASRWRRRIAVLGGLGALGMVVLLAQASLVASTGYNVERLEDTKAALIRSNQQLEDSIASLRSLDRIEREARTRLKMVTPSSYVYIRVEARPQAPSPLLRKALKEEERGPAPPAWSWWEQLIRTFVGSRSQP
ncbi:MAG: septum formation initiator family protein [Chloroflexi bacterium]|nr:septum formation initiator family protein [Chloroflexota bacterium]